jgi:branched-subunit amino acid ABC-type transport system permease component
MIGVVVGGVTAGCLYALVALGLILIYRTSGALNLAQGATATAGAFAVSWLNTVLDLPVAVAVPAGVLLAAGLNLAVYGVCVYRLERRGADLHTTLVSTLGATLIITGVLELTLGYDPRTLHLLDGLPGPRVAGVEVPPVALLIIASALLAFTLLAAVLYRSRLGLVLRMGAADARLTALSGVSTTVLRAVVWAVAGALSGWGVVLFSAYQTLSTGMTEALLLSSAVAASWGAFRNIPLTLGGAVGLGVVTSLAQRFVPVVLVSSISLLLLVVVFLLWQRREGAVRVRAASLSSRHPRLAVKRAGWLPRAEVAVLVVAGFAVWWYGTEYHLSVLRYLVATMVAVVGVALALRYGHRLNLAAGGLMLIGAYLGAMLSRQLPVVVAIAVAVAVAAGLGALLGALTVGLEAIYYATLTLVVTAAVPELVMLAAPWTGGAHGTSLPPLPDPLRLGGIGMLTPLLVVLAGVVLALYYRYGLSVLGARALASTTDRSLAEASGLNPVAAFLLVESVSAGLLGLAGALLAFDIGYVGPQQWGLGYTLMLVAAVLIGGGWSATGLAVATAVIGLVPTLVGDLGGWPPVIFGAVLTTLILFAPDGVDGLYSGLTPRPRRQPVRIPEVSRA